MANAIASNGCRSCPRLDARHRWQVEFENVRVGRRSEELAQQIALQTDDQEQQIAVAHNAVFGRQPTESEWAPEREFLRQQSERYKLREQNEDEEQDSFAANNGALVDLCLVLLNSAEFLYVD